MFLSQPLLHDVPADAVALEAIEWIERYQKKARHDVQYGSSSNFERVASQKG